MTPTGSEPLRVLDARELDLMDRYWRAANYVSVGQIYLLDNPLLHEPLPAQHVKQTLLEPVSEVCRTMGAVPARG
jgi:xylulose-5-phosphate/fructose-6-phosphate phosphoketolase